MKEKIDEGLKGFETVQVSFRSHKAAQQFRNDMKAKFNYPETKSRYQVVHGQDEEGNTVIVESTLFNEMLTALKEASKKRFIDKVWNNPDFDESNVSLAMRDYDASNVGLLNKGLPSAEDITKWIDSGAADKFLKSLNFNWQNFTFDAIGPDGKTPLYIYLIDEYLKYMKEGGSRKNRQQALKLNPKEVFKSNKMLIAEEEGADTSDCDFVFLNSLENDKFIFVVPMNWQACKFIDSFECGGQGAKWCIGYANDDGYFNDYTKNGDLFICAYSKKKDAPKNELKYMIQLSQYISETRAWKQPDDPEDTIPIEKFDRYFGHNANEFIAAMQQHILVDDNVYSDNGLDKWFGDEGPSGVDEAYWYREDSLEDTAYYYSEFLNYTKDDLLRRFNGSEVTIDCEHMNVSGAKLKASSSDDVDIPTFVNFLKDNGINAESITFENGTFEEVIWEPEACNGGADQCPDVYFDNCKIRTLRFDDLSGEDGCTAGIILLKGCELNTLHWGVSEEDWENGIINSSGLHLTGGVKPKNETFELYVLEENISVMRNRLLESFLTKEKQHIKEEFDDSSKYDELEAVLGDIMDMEIGGSVDDLASELFHALDEGYPEDSIKETADELALALDDAGFEGEATDIWDAIAYIGL